MKLAVDAVFYVREGFNFEKAFKEVLKILGEDVKILSIEYPELALISEDSYYYRCGFMLDKELKEELNREEIEKIKEKIKEQPKNVIFASQPMPDLKYKKRVAIDILNLAKQNPDINLIIKLPLTECC